MTRPSHRGQLLGDLGNVAAERPLALIIGTGGFVSLLLTLITGQDSLTVLQFALLGVFALSALVIVTSYAAKKQRRVADSSEDG